MANVINPYDQSAWSTYTPLTSQEILMPAMMMRERHDKLDEEYATINDELQKVAFIAEHESDPAVKQKYNNYLTSLSQSRDELMNKGLNSSSRRKMLDLRGRYQSEIQPINMGYQMKLKDMDNYNQLVAKDPTYIGSNPTNRTVTDYINNGLQPFTQQGISGALLTKMANDKLQPLSQLDQVRDIDKDLIPILEATIEGEKVSQYVEIARRYGVKPGTEGHKLIMQEVKNNILNATGISNWASPEQLNQASEYINMAENATIGKTQYNMVNDNSYAIAMQKQAAKEAAKAMEQEVDSLPNFNYQPGVAEPTQKRIDNLKKDYEGIIKYRDNKKLSGWDKGNPYKKLIYDEAIKLQDNIKNMNEEQINEFFKTYNVPLPKEGAVNTIVADRDSKNLKNQILQQAIALKEYNKYDNIQFEIAKEQGITKEQADALAQSYLDNTSTMLGGIYSASSEGLIKGEEHALNSTKQSMFNNNQTQVYIDGERKSLDDIPQKLKNSIITKSTTLGHNIFNPQTGLSTAVFTYTAGEDEADAGKTFKIEVPDMNLSKNYENSRRIMKVIRESNTYLPKEVELSDGQKAKVYSEPTTEGKWQTYVQLGNEVWPYEKFKDLEMFRLKNDYYNRSLTPAQGKYYQSGQLK